MSETLSERLRKQRMSDPGHARWADRSESLMREAADTFDALTEALTPSAETKAAYMGEFKFPITDTIEDDEGHMVEVTRQMYVPWDTVKQIMKAIRDRALDKAIQEPGK